MPPKVFARFKISGSNPDPIYSFQSANVPISENGIIDVSKCPKCIIPSQQFIPAAATALAQQFQSTNFNRCLAWQCNKPEQDHESSKIDHKFMPPGRIEFDVWQNEKGQIVKAPEGDLVKGDDATDALYRWTLEMRICSGRFESFENDSGFDLVDLLEKGMMLPMTVSEIAGYDEAKAEIEYAKGKKEVTAILSFIPPYSKKRKTR